MSCECAIPDTKICSPTTIFLGWREELLNCCVPSVRLGLPAVKFCSFARGILERCACIPVLTRDRWRDRAILLLEDVPRCPPLRRCCASDQRVDRYCRCVWQVSPDITVDRLRRYQSMVTPTLTPYFTQSF